MNEGADPALLADAPSTAGAEATRRRKIMRELEKRLVSAGEAIDRALGKGFAREHPHLIGLVVIAHEVSALRGSSHSNANSLIRAVVEVARQMDRNGEALSEISATLVEKM